MNVESLQTLEYALAKQIPLGAETLTIESNYGNLELTGTLGRKAVKTLRLLIIKEAGNIHAEIKKESAE